MSIEYITVMMFGLFLLMLFIGFPIAIVLGGGAVSFGLLFWGPESVFLIVAKANDTLRAPILIAIPLFVYMAYMLEKSGVAEDLYGVIHSWMGRIGGGLAVGTVLANTVVAAMSGISTTGVLLMGIIGLPPMFRRKYDKKLAMGAVMAGGALGPLIPPSVVMVIYALISGESVGKLFLGGVIPGLVLSALFCSYILIRCYFNPSLGPPLSREERATWREKFRALKGIVFPLALVAGVLGSIFTGVATATEASAVGAVGAIISALVNRKFKWDNVFDAGYRTLRTVGMVMWIIFGASCFSVIYQGLGAADLIQRVLTTWPVNRWVIMILIQITWFILGCLMDATSILMVSCPVFVPVAITLGFDPLWFGILFVVNTEMGYLTPPFGVNLFVMRGIVDDSITTQEIYQSIVPFVALQAIGLVLTMAIPGIATWLPELVFK